MSALICRKESWNLAQAYKGKLFLNLLNGSAPAAGRAPAARLALSQVRRRTPDDIQIVEFVMLGERLLTWFISKDRFQCRSTSIGARALQEKIDVFLAQVRQRQPAQESAQGLYDLLIQPVGDLLEPSRTVVVIPDRGLYALPFPALHSRSESRYWIEMTPILASPSITHLFSGSGRASLSPQSVAFGSRVYDAYINTELNTLRNIDSGILLKEGSDVTKASFLKALQDNSLFYYAGHSAFDMGNALQSSILLDGTRPGPNTVSALDIMKQPIARDAMIILSSCETSSGNAIDGPGIRGLTSAFLIGGAGSVVGSLWRVDSSSTMQLMSAMFASLVQDSRPVIESLRAAQVRLIRDPAHSHPYYWSGFVVTGNLSATGPHFLNAAAPN